MSAVLASPSTLSFSLKSAWPVQEIYGGPCYRRLCMAAFLSGGPTETQLFAADHFENDSLNDLCVAL